MNVKCSEQGSKSVEKVLNCLCCHGEQEGAAFILFHAEDQVYYEAAYWYDARKTCTTHCSLSGRDAEVVRVFSLTPTKHGAQAGGDESSVPSAKAAFRLCDHSISLLIIVEVRVSLSVVQIIFANGTEQPWKLMDLRRWTLARLCISVFNVPPCTMQPVIMSETLGSSIHSDGGIVASFSLAQNVVNMCGVTRLF